MKRWTTSIAFVVGLMLMCLATFWWLRSKRLMSPVKNQLSDVESDAAQRVPSQSTIPIGAHQLDPVLELARRHASAFDREVKDYVAVMTKEERVGGVLGQPQTMTIKLRCPQRTAEGSELKTHVYLRFEEPKGVRGREVIWVDGKNEGKLIAHEAGWFNVARVQLDPEGTLAMLGNKYPITQIGLGKLLRKLIEKGERDRQDSDCQVTIREDRFQNIACTVIEVVHPQAKPTLDFHIARIYLDEARHVPLCYEAFLWPKEVGDSPPLEERYTYSDIRFNVGLTDEDFNPDNTEYTFP